MMKRWLAALLLAALLVITGCASGQNDDKMPAGLSGPAITEDVNNSLPGRADAEKKNNAETAVMPAAEKANGAGADAITVNEEAAPAADTRDREINEAEREDSFRLYLTRDWGAEVLDSSEVIVKPDYSLLDYMKEEWQLATGFGGGFIMGINGLESTSAAGEHYDWFFYINGETSPAGAAQFKPRAGDVIYWDYHQWASSAGSIEEPQGFPPQ